VLDRGAVIWLYRMLVIYIGLLYICIYI
jgi:hypothetical protein